MKTAGGAPPTQEPTMKRDNRTDGEEALHHALRDWQVDASLSPRFNENVWRRIARQAELRGRFANAWRNLLLQWDMLVRKPVGAAGILAALILLGIGLGSWHAQSYQAQTERAWQDAYLNSVSPTTIALNQ